MLLYKNHVNKCQLKLDLVWMFIYRVEWGTLFEIMKKAAAYNVLPFEKNIALMLTKASIKCIISHDK